MASILDGIWGEPPLDSELQHLIFGTRSSFHACLFVPPGFRWEQPNRIALFGVVVNLKTAKLWDRNCLEHRVTDSQCRATCQGHTHPHSIRCFSASDTAASATMTSHHRLPLYSLHPPPTCLGVPLLHKQPSQSPNIDDLCDSSRLSSPWYLLHCNSKIYLDVTILHQRRFPWSHTLLHQLRAVLCFNWIGLCIGRTSLLQSTLLTAGMVKVFGQ